MVVEGGEGEVGILAAVMGQLTLCSSAIEAALQRPRVDCSGSTCIALARKARSLGRPLQHYGIGRMRYLCRARFKSSPIRAMQNTANVELVRGQGRLSTSGI